MLLYRVLTTIVGVPILFAIFFYGGVAGNFALFSAAFIIGMLEYVKMAFPNDKANAAATLVCGSILYFGLTIGGVYLPSVAGVSLKLAAVAGGAGLCGLFYLFRVKDVKESARDMGLSLVGVFYAGGLFALLPLIYAKAEAISSVNNFGAKYIVLMLAVVWMGDTGAYFAGRALGRHKLYPAVSPNKTWEGSIGGAAASVAGAFLFRWIFGLESVLPPALTAAVAFAGGVFEQVGDLFESLLKRSFGAKDSGKLLPGHGGMLDRLDGVLAAGVVFYIAVRFLR